ncbi:MAG: outer membrane beta-barrel protein [Bacteroidales bacterium]|nr:outer membrane beta-barrel protein [Bacteroidales bacterium]
MRKLLAALAILLCSSALPLFAQNDEIEYSAEFLDTLDLTRYGYDSINDYSMIGVNYGVTFSGVYFNPYKMGSDIIFNPTYFSVMYTHYEKMFNYLPYFGLTLGFSYSHSGCRFTDDPDTGFPRGFIDGATYESMETVEMPAMMHMHFDNAPFKVLANLGGYLGYRMSVTRNGIWLDEEYTNKFRDYERQFDYGLMGGAGIGFMFDPVEIHLNILGRWSLQNLYEPDYENAIFHPYNTYYYRYANPIDVSVTLGVYFQLTKRTGRTNRQLKQQARDIVYGTPKND